MQEGRPWPPSADEHLERQHELQLLSWKESFLGAGIPAWSVPVTAQRLQCQESIAEQVLRSLEVKGLMERRGGGTWSPTGLTLQLAETWVRRDYRPELAQVRDTRDRILASVAPRWGYMMPPPVCVDTLGERGVSPAAAWPHIRLLVEEGAIEAPRAPERALLPARGDFRRIAHAAATRTRTRETIEHLRGLAPADRGRGFEAALSALFESHCEQVTANIRTIGEQHDMIARVDSNDYVVECRWSAGPYGNSDRDQLVTKAERRRGHDALVLSMGGITTDAVERANREKQGTLTLLAGEAETTALVHGLCTIKELVRHKRQALVAESMQTEEAIPPIYADHRGWWLAPYWQVPM